MPKQNGSIPVPTKEARPELDGAGAKWERNAHRLPSLIPFCGKTPLPLSLCFT